MLFILKLGSATDAQLMEGNQHCKHFNNGDLQILKHQKTLLPFTLAFFITTGKARSSIRKYWQDKSSKDAIASEKIILAQ